MKNLGGRPRKGSLEEKKAIVDHYFVTRCAENTGVLKKRGVYKALSDFAVEKGYDYAPEHFRRDPEIRDYIESYAKATETKEPSEDILPVFVPMDISLIIEKSRSEIAEMLRERDKYYESLYHAANATLQPFRAKVKAYETATEDLQIQLDKNKTLVEDNATLASKLRHANEEIAYLRSYIKKHVLPDQAEAVFTASRKPETAISQAAPFVTGNINKLINEDQSLRIAAKKAADNDDYADWF